MLLTAPPPDPRLLNAGASPFGWHKLDDFIRCPRRYGLSRVLEEAGMGSGGSRAQGLGGLVHVGLAHHYGRMRLAQAGGNVDDLYPVPDAIRAAGVAAGASEDAVRHAQALCAAYAVAWQHEVITVLHVEEVFWFQPAGIHRPLTCRLDLVYEQRGRVRIIDHKTSARITANHPKFYGISGQFLLFRWLGHLLWGERFAGAQANLIQTTSPAFERPPMPAAPDLLARFPDQVRYYMGCIKNLEDSGLPYHQWPAAATEETCFGRYGWCKHAVSCQDGLVDA